MFSYYSIEIISQLRPKNLNCFQEHGGDVDLTLPSPDSPKTICADFMQISHFC
jgi:hypothetical protein